jgi:hypothetical protein
MPRTSYAGFAGSALSQSFGQYKPDPQDRIHMGYEQGSMGYNIRGTNTYPPQGSSLSGYQNPLHQSGPSPLSANTGLGNISEHGPSNASSIPRPLSNYYGSTGSTLNYGSYSGNYQGQSGNQYASTSRTSSDGYPSIVGLQTPTSMTDFASTLPSGHDSGYMPATSGPISVGAGTGAHTPVQSHHQADYSSLSSYTHAPSTYVNSSPTYQTAPSQSQHSHHSSLDHMPYSSAMPGASLPATNMLLGESLPHNFYQQEEASYPTPTHTKQPPWS